MQFKNRSLSVHTTAETDVIDITPLVSEAVRETRIRNGSVTLFIPGSTAALSTIEFESGVINDLKKAIDRIAPRDLYYEHNERWGDGNGYSHVRAALLGPSLHIPIVEGVLTLGTWQQIVLLDFDNRPRKRRIILQTLGEQESREYRPLSGRLANSASKNEVVGGHKNTARRHGSAGKDILCRP